MTGHDDFDRTLAGWFEADALVARARRRSRAGPRRHPPPQAPAGLARRSRQPLGRRGAAMPVRAPAHARSRASGCAGRRRSSCCC